MVVPAKARGSIVLSARSECRAVERINRWPIFCDDRDMQWLLQLTFAANPKVRFAAAAKASGWLPGLLSRRFHNQRIAKRRQGLFIKVLCARIVRHRKSHVINHDALREMHPAVAMIHPVQFGATTTTATTSFANTSKHSSTPTTSPRFQDLEWTQPFRIRL